MYYNFEKEFIKELSILLMKDFNKDTFLNVFGKTYNGLQNGDNVGIMPTGTFSDAVIASCNPNFTDPKGISTGKWVLNNFMIPKQFCYDNLITELKRNEKIYDLQSNEAANAWMTQYVEKAFVDSVIAKTFFASTDSSDNVTTGLDGINGILTTMLAQVSGGEADGSQVVPVATQTKAWAKTGTNAIDLLENLIDAAPASVKRSDDAVIVVTQALYDALSYNLRVNKGIYVDAQWDAMFGGLKTTTYNGYTLVVIPALDGLIEEMQSGDQFYGKPIIAFMTTKSNIMIGSQGDEEAGVSDVDIFDDKNTQTTKVLVKFSLGVHIPDAKGWSLCI